MDALLFPSEEALRVALRAGLVPPELSAAAAQVARQPDGSLVLEPSQALTPKLKKALTTAGIALVASPPGAAPLSCWAEAVRPTRTDAPAGALPVTLFALTGERALLDLAGELLRLGCDRQLLRLVHAPGTPIHALVRVVDPPWYVVSRALDHLDGLRVFVPSPAGQELVFTELGFTHPLAAALQPGPEQLLLIPQDGPWWRVPAGRWADVDRQLDVAGVEARQALTPEQALPRVTVTLKLGRSARQEAPALFVVEDGLATIEALVRTLPEAQLSDLLFAVAGTTVLLRPRPGREAAAAALPGKPFGRVAELPNLLAPVGFTVEPPLRRDRLRDWLAPELDVLTWLTPTPGGFRPVSVPDDAFRPLTEWVDYVVDQARDALAAWVDSATFALSPFVAHEDVAPTIAQAPTAAPLPAPSAGGRAPKPRAEAKPAPAAKPGAAEPSRLVLPAIEVALAPSELEEAITRAEAEFVELDAPAESPERLERWLGLAQLYGRAGRGRDAGMAWVQALWQAPATDAPELARRWAESTGTRAEALLQLPTPTLEQARGAVAWLVSAATAERAVPQLPDWVTFLDRHDAALDVRSLWLGRWAISQLSGGDKLGLARARDRVLGHLQRGLNLDRDVPRLMRVAGQAAGGHGTERALRVATQLENLLKAFDETPRKRSPIEAQPYLTKAYVSFEFAWGFARLGQGDRARALRVAALAALEAHVSNPADATRPVHQFLTRAYASRIEQALEGASPDTPLPAEIGALLSGLESQLRYAVDRLRGMSVVLEPQERLNAIVNYWQQDQRRGEELAALRGLSDAAELARAIDARKQAAADPKLGAEERARLIDGLLDFLPSLPESAALPRLQELVGTAADLPARQRVLVIEDAMKIAGHFGRTPLVKQLVLTFSGLLSELGAEGVQEIGGALAAGMRSLRRVGLRTEASELLARASSVVRGSDVPSLITRLSLAAGFASLGSPLQAQPIIDEALTLLSRESGIKSEERMRLTRAAARAIGSGPADTALPWLARLAQQLPWITDHFSTNSYFCLYLVDFADALVLGHVGDDLTLNEATRHFLEEDEFVVRQRVHRDVGG